MSRSRPFLLTVYIELQEVIEFIMVIKTELIELASSRAIQANGTQN